MVNPMINRDLTRLEIANRLFFRLYQCANMLHKTGTRAVEKEGLTTQQWAVLGALSRKEAEGGMNVGDLANYLKTKNGRHVWEKEAQPKIRAYYESALVDFSTGDLTHTLHYLLKLLDNMEKIDKAAGVTEV